MIKTAPSDIYTEYENGKLYKQSIDLYEKVKVNENFYLGKQWEGVNAPDLDKPMFNVLRRVVTYQVAMVVSDDVGVSVSPVNPNINLNTEFINEAILYELDRIKEENSLSDINRMCVRDASVDGDTCLHSYFDPSAETGDPDVKGAIRCEVIQNLNVFFGNRHVRDKEKQPYIIISSRRMIESVKDEMKANKRPQSDIDQVKDDYEDSYYDNKAFDNEKVTVLTKYWKENGTVHVTKCTPDMVVMKATDTGMKLYPIAYMSWDIVKDSYHGEAALTGLIPNQIFINKILAMGMKSVKDTAFPKIIYDGSKITGGWSNRLGAIETAGDPNQAVYVVKPGGDMSPQVLQMFNTVMETTRDMMGASDAALGNVRPENTSAIIAVQQSTAVPLELFRREYYRFVEDYVRVHIDMMRAYYGTRTIGTRETETVDEMGNPVTVVEVTEFDFSALNDVILSLTVSIGESTYWSELMQMQTLENMLGQGIIDPQTYIQELPAKYVRNKNVLLEANRNMQAMMGGGANDVPSMQIIDELGIGPGNPGGNMADILMP